MLSRDTGFRKDSDESMPASNSFQVHPFEKGYRYELVYAGSYQNTVRITYNEYFLRESESVPIERRITEDYEVSVNSARDIAFHGYQVVVLKADSAAIEFKVIAD